MGQTNPEDSSEKKLVNQIGKIGRSDLREWVKVCPNCFSIDIHPLTNISGTIIQEQWYCQDCDYAGFVIEVKTEDLIRFRLQRLALQYNQNIKAKGK
ncbi:MAG: hypothetical protein ACFFDU_05890 [Candidatus Thorarchaeota archaeon]